MSPNIDLRGVKAKRDGTMTAEARELRKYETENFERANGYYISELCIPPAKTAGADKAQKVNGSF